MKENPMEKELLPCPWCEMNVEITEIRWKGGVSPRGNFTLYHPPSAVCILSGFNSHKFITRDKAIEFWNTRAKSAEAPKSQEAGMKNYCIRICPKCGKEYKSPSFSTTCCAECWNKSPSPASERDRLIKEMVEANLFNGPSYVETDRYDVDMLIVEVANFILSRERKGLVLDKIDDLINVQRHSADSHDYHHGMLNGLILAKAIIEDKTPHFYTRPDGRPQVPSVEEIKKVIFNLEIDGSISQHDVNDIAQAINDLLGGKW